VRRFNPPVDVLSRWGLASVKATHPNAKKSPAPLKFRE